MIMGNEEERKWSDKKMEADEGVRTLECLRGRLLAERQASRVAKEEAELMGNKLIELENRLREETKLRNKAEKKLEFLNKKLESFKMTHNLAESEQSSSLEENNAPSCSSSSSTSGPIEEDQDPKSQVTTPLASQNLESSESQNTPFMHSLESPLKEKSSISGADSNIKDSSLENSSDKSIPSCKDLNTDYHRVELESYASNGSDNGDDSADNSMALVPVSWPVTKPSSELKIVNVSVSEVLDALRHARERIQCSMERRRHMITTGPA
ncbi:hypothetical protein CFOL_v3_27646 [Cephalotus follicularis]|uniref:Uncharacterized protein n=1 Tax=Cephalotus follicularis TaxID=3775 RepID=A0A1Q3CVI9_CEPFO|nr:hypothetical protein CFOL_v3_27646 [Cephalotus follicularis]